MKTDVAITPQLIAKHGITPAEYAHILDILPKIAGHPLAILAYLCFFAAWLLWYHRWRKSADFLAALKAVPPSERRPFAEKAGYSYDDLARLPEKDRIKWLTSRHRLIAYIATLIALALLVLAALVAYRQNYSALRADHTRLLQESHAVEAAISRFRISVEGAIGSADTAGRLAENPELEGIGQKLRRAADEFDAKYALKLTREMAADLALARARAAVALGNYEEAAALLRDSDIAAQTSTTVSMLLVRADAAGGLGQWSASKALYQRILGIDPNHIAALAGVGNAAWELRQPGESATMWSRVLGLITRATQTDQAALAGALNNRGIAYAELGNLADARADCARAIQVLSPLVKTTRPDLANELARAYNNRGTIYEDLRQFALAVDDFDRAVAIREDLLKRGRSDVAPALANALSNRGGASRGAGRMASALADGNKALQLLEALVKSGRRDLSFDLARALVNLGGVCLDSGLPGLDYLERGVEILDGLVSTSRPELAGDLAIALTGRATANDRRGAAPESVADYARAIPILRRLADSGSPVAAVRLAEILDNRSTLLLAMGQLTNSAQDNAEATAILTPIVASGRLEFGVALARAQQHSASLHLAQGDRTNCIAAYTRAIETMDAMTAAGTAGPPDELVACLNNRGGVQSKLGNFTLAVADFTRAISMLVGPGKTDLPGYERSLASLLDNRGSALCQLGDLTNAILDHTRVIVMLSPPAEHARPRLPDLLAPCKAGVLSTTLAATSRTRLKTMHCA